MGKLHPITLQNQLFVCPSDAIAGDQIGKVSFLWSHQKFWNHYFGTSYTDASYGFSIVGGADISFAVDSTGELSVINPANFVSDTFVTVRVSCGGFYQDAVCSIVRSTSINCVYFDSTYNLSNGTPNGTRSRPFLKFNGSGLTPTPGKTYLWRRDRTYTREWTRIVSPKIGNEYPDWITFDAWGQGERPLIDGHDNVQGSTNHRFITVGHQNLSNTNLDESLTGNKFRVANIQTTHDKSNTWYPIEIKGMGDYLEFRRLSFEETIFSEGFIYASVYTNRPYEDRHIYMESIETLNNVERSIKLETGGVTFLNGRHRNIGPQSTEHPGPGAANWPNVTIKYLDCEGENIALNNAGLQCRAGLHQYEWCYLKGYGAAMTVFIHATQNGKGGLYEVKNSGFKNIIVDSAKTCVSSFARNTPGDVADGVYFINVDAVNCAKGFEVAQGAINTLFAYCMVMGSGGDGMRVYAGAGAGTKIHNFTAFGNTGQDIEISRNGVTIVNSNYGTLTGTPTIITSSTSTNQANLLAAGTDLGYQYDLEGNIVANPPSIGAVEFADVPDPEYFNLIINSSLGGNALEITSGPYREGDNVLLEAVPNDGFKIKWWEMQIGSESVGVVGSGSYSFSFNMPADNVTITPIFELIPTPSPSGGLRFKGKLRLA